MMTKEAVTDLESHRLIFTVEAKKSKSTVQSMKTPEKGSYNKNMATDSLVVTTGEVGQGENRSWSKLNFSDRK